MKWTRVVFLILLIVLLNVSISSAFNLLGISWGYYNKDLLPEDFAGTSSDRIFNPYIGGNLAGGEVFYIGGAYNNIKLSENGQDAELYGRILQVYAGFRYYMMPHKKGLTSPYVVTELFKSYTKIEQKNQTTYNSEDINYLKKLYQPWGFSAGIGIDYTISAPFFIGLETGLRWSFAKPKANNGNVFGTRSENLREIRLYSIIHIDFSW
ncbi:MAG: hypothetical protein GY855_08910 [candidate division Zixibacteria bacterium]|nr:hypothetical protein [candidate division Zixibacteria bacterium]